MDMTQDTPVASTPAASVAPVARAVFRPQGTCPKQWCAQVNGETLFDARGGARRYSTEKAALSAAVAAAKAA